MKWFKISEFYKSSLADSRKIDNTPTAEAVDNIEILVKEVLDPARDLCGYPIFITSGYRCKQLNDLVKGAKNSQHLKGKAADITTKSKSKNKELFDLLVLNDFNFDQLIDEYNYSWLHVSFDKDKSGQQKQILHLS